jgi:hypothetical protein
MHASADINTLTLTQRLTPVSRSFEVDRQTRCFEFVAMYHGYAAVLWNTWHDRSDLSPKQNSSHVGLQDGVAIPQA